MKNGMTKEDVSFTYFAWKLHHPPICLQTLLIALQGLFLFTYIIVITVFSCDEFQQMLELRKKLWELLIYPSLSEAP